MEIDLHGIKHENVKDLLDSGIYMCMRKKIARLTVITGNSSEMKKIVVSVASEYGLTAVESMFNSAEVLIDLV